MVGESRRQAFVLTGFTGAVTQGSCTVIQFDRVGRWRRAGVALGKSWAIAAVAIFIPVAHFVLVPGFLAFGLYQFAYRLGTPELACDARGSCPDCGTEQALDVAPRWRMPQPVTCSSCHRGLTLSLPDLSSP